jgi:hypothetical protein
LLLRPAGTQPGRGRSRVPHAALQNDLIVTLLFTILLEGIFAFAYCVWQRKPIQPILFTTVSVNLITQSLLWILLTLFFRYYLMILFLAELVIWISEGVILSSIRANKLRLTDALLLSLGMNLVSFGVGWSLPV